MHNKSQETINNVIAGTSMIVYAPDGCYEIGLGKRISFMNMMNILATLGLTYSGEALTFHPTPTGECYQVENSKGETLAIVHQGIWEDCEAA